MIFDVGANIGQFAEVNLNLTDKIYCFEPDIRSFEIVKDKFKNNDKIICENIALSDTEGFIDFYKNIQHSTISTASKDWINKSRFSNIYTWDISTRVKSTSLSKLIEKYGIPELIKIDVEGYEKNVLFGLKEKVPMITFEWAEETKKDILESVDYLHSLKYNKFFIQYGDEYIFRPKEYISYEDIIKIINELQENRKELWGMIWSF